MLANDHPFSQLSDFALDLLAPLEHAQVSRHLQQCATCRRRLQEERELVNATRKTILAATQPSFTRLQQLAPTPPRSAGKPLIRAMRPVLALSMVAMLLFAVLQMQTPRSGAIPAFQSSTAVAATATLTPTTTMQPDDQPDQEWQEDVLSGLPPRPMGTPLAAIPNFASN